MHDPCHCHPLSGGVDSGMFLAVSHRITNINFPRDLDVHCMSPFTNHSVHSQDNGHAMDFHLRLSPLHLVFDIRATEMMRRTNVGVHINNM